MAATLTSLDAALKETWTSDRLEEQLYQDNPLLDELEKTTRYNVGAQAITPLHVGRNGGYTALPAAGGTLNTAGEQKLAQAVWNYTHHHQQIKLQGSAIDGTMNNSVAVASAVDIEVSGALNDLRKQLSRQAFSSGDALVAQCAVGGPSATINLNVADGQNALQRGWLFPGLYVDVGTTANEIAIVNGEAITAVSADDAAQPTITVTSSVSTTTSHYVSVKDSRSGTTSYEMNGLDNIAGSATASLGGINPTTETSWKPTVNSTSTTLTLDVLLSLQRGTYQKTGVNGDMLIFSPLQRQNFYSLLQQQERFVNGRLGAGAVEDTVWNGMKVIAHPDAKNGRVYVISKKNLFILCSGKPYWQSQVTGGKALDWIQGEDSYGGKLTYRIQLGTNKRNAHAAVTGLTT